MPPPSRLPLDAWMDARVEAYVDDALPDDERSRFEARLWADPHWQEQVERARRIQGALRSRDPSSSPALTDDILQQVSSLALKEKH